MAYICPAVQHCSQLTLPFIEFSRLVDGDELARCLLPCCLLDLHDDVNTKKILATVEIMNYIMNELELTWSNTKSADLSTGTNACS